MLWLRKWAKAGDIGKVWARAQPDQQQHTAQGRQPAHIGLLLEPASERVVAAGHNLQDTTKTCGFMGMSTQLLLLS